MTTRWNTEQVARELGYLYQGDMHPKHVKSARASVRSRIKRWQDERQRREPGWVFDVVIDGKTGEKLYRASEIREAQAASPGKGHRKKTA